MTLATIFNKKYQTSTLFSEKTLSNKSFIKETQKPESAQKTNISK
jgi:hypothetical protein